MLIPPMCEIKTFDQIVAELVEIYRRFVPNYIANESDDVMPVLESFAYRELMLRNFFNAQIAGSFWQTATGENLDFIANFFGVERLAGAKPSAQVRFTISAPLTYEYVIDQGSEILNSDGSVSILVSDVTIPPGSTYADGTAELQVYSAASDAVAVSPLVPRPYLSSVQQLDGYSGGSDVESDASVRKRIDLAFDAQTTAGSIGGYTVHTLSADARVDDVKVKSPSPGIVDVVLYSHGGVDQTMIDRVSASLNADTVRPLTDTVNVVAASVMTYSIEAYIAIDAGADIQGTLFAAKARLDERLAETKIGKSVTIGSIIAALSVDGVDDVTVVSPTSAIAVSDYQIAIASSVEVGVV
ncbi:MAG: baseplate J/gp47 family protein [Sulfuricurvum sp.]|nr:baseplate J/gp47 family protein [Sulfuricurvum sp.]